MVCGVARPLSRRSDDLLFRRLFSWQVGRFFGDPKTRTEFLPLLYQPFVANPTTHEAFFGLNQDLRSAIAAGRRRSQGCSGSPARSASSSAPPTPT